jgi:hypothetical protein
MVVIMELNGAVVKEHGWGLLERHPVLALVLPVLPRECPVDS